MQMKIIVETEEEFNKWLTEQKTFGETVMGTTAEEVMETADEVAMETEMTSEN